MNFYQSMRYSRWFAIAAAVYSIAIMLFTFYIEKQTGCQAKFAGVQKYGELKGVIFQSMELGLGLAGLFVLAWYKDVFKPLNRVADYLPVPLVFVASSVLLLAFCAVALGSPIFTWHFVSVLAGHCGYPMLAI